MLSRSDYKTQFINKTQYSHVVVADFRIGKKQIEAGFF